ncbi:MAG: Gx transporter family protein [Spirochaetales bacterium]|nr:Gx transporter family protein [Spirochaetales bacterium]
MSIQKAGRFRLTSERKDLIAFLAGLSLFLSLVEYLIPKPVPFLRLGLANIPLLMGLLLLNPLELVLLALLKSLGQALVGGTLLSYVFLFSLAGTFSSVFIMGGIKKLAGKHVSLIGLGTAGALASNISQLLLGIFFLFGPESIMLAPLFLITGLVSGSLLGGLTQYFISRSRWYRMVSVDTKEGTP